MDCFKSNGSETTEIRNLEPFTEVEINDKIQVTIFKGSDYKVEVLAGKHIIKNIYTGVRNGVLKIENRNKCNFVRGYKKQMEVHVTLPDLIKVTHNSVADLKFEENYVQDSLCIDAESSGNTYINGTFRVLKTISNGNGDLYISGETQRLHVYTKGTNYVYAQNLIITDEAIIQSVTIGDCYVNGKILKKLEYTISSNGNIYYTGNIPSITGACDKNAKGILIKQN